MNQWPNTEDRAPPIPGDEERRPAEGGVRRTRSLLRSVRCNRWGARGARARRPPPSRGGPCPSSRPPRWPRGEVRRHRLPRRDPPGAGRDAVRDAPAGEAAGGAAGEGGAGDGPAPAAARLAPCHGSRSRRHHLPVGAAGAPRAGDPAEVSHDVTHECTRGWAAAEDAPLVPLDLSSKAARRLVENAALVRAHLAGDADEAPAAPARLQRLRRRARGHRLRGRARRCLAGYARRAGLARVPARPSRGEAQAGLAIQAVAATVLHGNRVSRIREA